jgi:uncharacterized protein (DUF305 family)
MNLNADVPATRPRLWLGPAVLVLAIMTGALGYWLGVRAAARPADQSAEAGFARDMIIHHTQAVEMALLARERTDDADLRQIALDMLLTQQNQIGQMQAWLTMWGLPYARPGAAMEWMGAPTNDLMPGMATPEQLNALRAARGLEADGVFLQLMIPHHRSGVDMAAAILQQTERAEVAALALSIVNAQTSELALMQELLQAKGFPPVPDEAGSHIHP